MEKSVTLDELSKEVNTITQTIKEKLSCIQNELKAPKNQYNKFGKYYYRNCEDILEAVKPICNKYRATLVIGDEIILIGERYYIKAVTTLLDWDTDESLEKTAYARECETKKGMDDSQITGATSSYARKYALNGLFNIDDTKDADADINHQKDDEEKPNEVSRNNSTSTQEGPTIMDLTILWGKQRKRMDELGINYRSQALEGWFTKATGSANQDATEDINHMTKLTAAYKALIDSKEKNK